jgi:hypothetical protein
MSRMTTCIYIGIFRSTFSLTESHTPDCGSRSAAAAPHPSARGMPLHIPTAACRPAACPYHPVAGANSVVLLAGAPLCGRVLPDYCTRPRLAPSVRVTVICASRCRT